MFENIWPDGQSNSLRYMLSPGINKHRISTAAFDAKYVAQHSCLDFCPNIQTHNTVILKRSPTVSKKGKITLLDISSTSNAVLNVSISSIFQYSQIANVNTMFKYFNLFLASPRVQPKQIHVVTVCKSTITASRKHF